MKVLVPLIIVPLIILLLSTISIAKTSDMNLNEISIGNQEALSFAHGSATNSIHISDSSKGGSMIKCPAAQGDIGWIVGYPADGYGVILHTTNGGKNWTRQGSPETAPNVPLNDVRAIDPCNVWAVGDPDHNYAVILRTMDGGKTWIRCGSPGMVPDFGAQGIGIVDRKIAWVVGSNGTIIHTKDGGRTWVQQTSNTRAFLMKVEAIDRFNAWVVGDKDNGYAVILRTSDGGRTWTRQGNATSVKAWGLIDATAANNKTAWVVGVDQTVLKTIDGGASWQIQMHSDIAGAHINAACAIDECHAWITQDFGVVYLTRDGGKTWKEQNPEAAHRFYLMSVSAKTSKEAWVVGQMQSGTVGEGVIMHTANFGINWTEQYAPVDVPFYRISFAGTKS